MKSAQIVIRSRSPRYTYYLGFLRTMEDGIHSPMAPVSFMRIMSVVGTKLLYKLSWTTARIKVMAHSLIIFVRIT